MVPGWGQAIDHLAPPVSQRHRQLLHLQLGGFQVGTQLGGRLPEANGCHEHNPTPLEQLSSPECSA